MRRLVLDMPLPIAAKINARLALHRQSRNAAHLIAICDAAIVSSRQDASCA